MSGAAIVRGDRVLTQEESQCLPFKMRSLVIKGFGRGSKTLGIPTGCVCANGIISQRRLPNNVCVAFFFFVSANLPIEDYEEELKHLPSGVYLGWAQVPSVDSRVCPMAMSIGWNPFFKNEKKAIVSGCICFGCDLFSLGRL
jgi:riboflavin kinase